MKVELFTLCDGAYNYNGKLTIVGTLDTITVQSLPATIDFGMALKILHDAEDKEQLHLHIKFLNPDGTIHPGELNADLNKIVPAEPTHISLAANINGLPFQQEGRYEIKVYIDEVEMQTSSLTINLKK